MSRQYFSPYASLCALHMICRWNVIFERDVATISHLLQLFFTPLLTGTTVTSLLPECRAHYMIDAPEASASRVFSLFRIVSLSFLRSRSAFFIANIRFFPVSIILGGIKLHSRHIRLKRHLCLLLRKLKHGTQTCKFHATILWGCQVRLWYYIWTQRVPISNLAALSILLL